MAERTAGTPVVVAVEPGSDVDLATWRREHAAGLRADATPYGLDRMGRHGVTVRTLGTDPPPALVGRALELGLRRARMDFAPWVRPRLRRADVLLTQHEKRGVPAILGSLLPGRPPVVTGLIWLADDDANVPPRLAAALRRLLARAGAVYVLSTAQVPIVRSWGVPADRVRYVPFGIDADFWTGGGVTGEPDLVVSAGSDIGRDYPTLLTAIGMLPGRSGARLQVGGGQRLDPAPGVEALGRLSHAELRDAYRRACVVAVALRPNVHVSGITVVLEGMACGRPVVTSATPGMEGYVEHGVNGLLVEPGDAAGFAGAIESLLADPDRARRMGAAARHAVEQEHSSERYAERLAELCGWVAVHPR